MQGATLEGGIITLAMSADGAVRTVCWSGTVRVFQVQTTDGGSGSTRSENCVPLVGVLSTELPSPFPFDGESSCLSSFAFEN